MTAPPRAQVRTVYVAETMLPTRHGSFRLRGYKHSIDGGRTFVEPTAIMCGQVEGKEDVSRAPRRGGGPRRTQSRCCRGGRRPAPRHHD
jgi:hypothetical protein